MADAFYSRMQAMAERLISKRGTIGSILAIGQPDEINGGDPVSVPHPCRLVIVGYDAQDIDGTKIQKTDVQIYISAVGLTVEPSVGMQVTAGTKLYRIINIDPNRFDGQTPVVFTAQGRTAP